MLKASALYIVIIIALVIAILSASLITTAFFYRAELQKNLRYDKLLTNMQSGTALLLSKNYDEYGKEVLIELSDDQPDSILLHKEQWGIYDLAWVKSYTLSDTLKKAFFIAEDFKDSTAMYLSDEDRPISVSGSTQITGDAVLPKAGIKQAYVDGRPYAGKKLVYGNIRTSQRNLPALNNERLAYLERLLNDSTGKVLRLNDSVLNSFFNPAQIIRISSSGAALQNITLKGKIVVLCDTTLTLSCTVNLKDILVIAPSIIIEEGFNGTCQLFARDSVIAGKNTVFNYPSCIGIIKSPGSTIQAKIMLGRGSRFSGVLFNWESSRSTLQTLIGLGKGAFVRGEIYASGYIKMEKPVTIHGKVSCNRFIIQTPATLYENYLIDIIINRNLRSKYYLSSAIFAGTKPDRKILKWLN
jgi:hypothetical protein